MEDDLVEMALRQGVSKKHPLPILSSKLITRFTFKPVIASAIDSAPGQLAADDKE